MAEAQKHLTAAYASLSALTNRQGFFICTKQDNEHQELTIEPKDKTGPTLQINFLTGKYPATQNGKPIPLTSSHDFSHGIP